MAKRWRPPPMAQEPPADAPAPAKKVTVDEGVVRKMLQINPDLRDGRTTFQVKKDMESGQVVRTDGRRSNGELRSTPTSSAGGGGSTNKSELEDALSFFMKGKTQDLEAKRADIQARRRQLEEEERALREGLLQDVAKFLRMLDPTVVATHGVTALSKHKAILDQAGITPAQVLEAVRKKG